MQNFIKLCQYLEDNEIDPLTVIMLIEILLKSKNC